MERVKSERWGQKGVDNAVGDTGADSKVRRKGEE